MNNRSLFLIAALIILNLHIGESCKGKPNPYPTIHAHFTKTQTHTYGDKYTYFNEELGQQYTILKLRGSSYQAGFAYGYLMKQEIAQSIEAIWAYYYTIAEQQFKFITKLPDNLQPAGRALAIKLYRFQMMRTHYLTKAFTPKRFLQEYEGISEGSGIEISKIIQINMIPEYTRAGCSILGAWGKSTVNNDFLQLRALDWDANNPMNKYPTVAVYDLTQKGSHPFVNIGFPGFVGSISALSQTIAVSQKVRKQDPVKQNETRIGKPWIYAVRDVVQFTDTIEGAMKQLNQTRRTCSIYLGVGSLKSQSFRLVEYSHKQFKTYDDHNFPYTPTHLQMDDVVFMPMHDNEDPCFNDMLKQKYGQITLQWMVNQLAPIHRTGDTHMIGYNLNTKELYFQVSYNKKKTFERPMIKIDLASYFKK